MITVKLDYVMADRKVSNKDLAKAVDITEVNLSRIKTEKVTSIRFSTLDKLCEALECEPGDLLKHTPDK